MDKSERRRPGRPAQSPMQRVQKERTTIDTHINLPINIVEKIDRLRRVDENRTDFIVRVLREYPEEE